MVKFKKNGFPKHNLESNEESLKKNNYIGKTFKVLIVHL